MPYNEYEASRSLRASIHRAKGTLTHSRTLIDRLQEHPLTHVTMRMEQKLQKQAVTTGFVCFRPPTALFQSQG